MTKRSAESEAFLNRKAVHELWEDKYLTKGLEPLYEMIFDRIKCSLAANQAYPVLDAGCGCAKPTSMQ